MAPRQAARAPRSGAGARTLPSALRSGPSSRDAIPAPPGPPGTRRPAGQGAGPGAASRGRAGSRGSDAPAPGWSQLVRTACRPAATQPSPWPSRARPETSPQFKTEGPVRQAPFQGVGECGCPRHASQGAVPAPQGSARGTRPPSRRRGCTPKTPERGFLDGDRPRRRAAPISDTHESLAYSLSSDLSMRAKRFTSYIPIWQGFDPW